MYSIEMRDNLQSISFSRGLDLTVYIGISSGEGMSGFHRGCVFCCPHEGNVQIENIHNYVCMFNCVPQFQ